MFLLLFNFLTLTLFFAVCKGLQTVCPLCKCPPRKCWPQVLFLTWKGKQVRAVKDFATANTPLLVKHCALSCWAAVMASLTVLCFLRRCNLKLRLLRVNPQWRHFTVGLWLWGGGRSGHLGGRERREVAAGVGDGEGDPALICCCVPLEEVGHVIIVVVVVQDCLVPSTFMEILFLKKIQKGVSVDTFILWSCV